jgi:hypothetical protein
MIKSSRKGMVNAAGNALIGIKVCLNEDIYFWCSLPMKKKMFELVKKSLSHFPGHLVDPGSDNIKSYNP